MIGIRYSACVWPLLLHAVGEGVRGQDIMVIRPLYGDMVFTM